MGYAIAEAAQARGARVVLVSGPTALYPPARVETIKVITADEMRAAVLERMNEATMIVKCAAVADYRPVFVSGEKLKRTGPITVEFEPTEDILAEVVRRRRPGQLIVGFAAETANIMESGRDKLLRKGADAIVVNDVSRDGVGMDADENAVDVFDAADRGGDAADAEAEAGGPHSGRGAGAAPAKVAGDGDGGGLGAG